MIRSVKFPNDGLMVVSNSSGVFNGLWSKCKTRKSFFCAETGFLFPKGTKAYRPLSNCKFRMQRIADVSVKKKKADRG